MYQINFNKPVKIHFMGIGGISMSGLAEILHAKGFTVVGSDAHESAITSRLPMASAQRTLHLISMWLSIQLPFIQITLNLPLPNLQVSR